MTWATIEDAWGNDVDTNMKNFYETGGYKVKENQQHLQQQLEQQQIDQQKTEQQKMDQLKRDKYKMQEINKNKFYNMVEKRLTILEKNNTFLNTKLDTLTLKIESEIKRIRLQLKKEAEVTKEVPTVAEALPENNYAQNINDIILFIIFGIFILILMDSMYRILQLKIKNI